MSMSPPRAKHPKPVAAPCHLLVVRPGGPQSELPARGMRWLWLRRACTARRSFGPHAVQRTGSFLHRSPACLPAWEDNASGPVTRACVRCCATFATVVAPSSPQRRRRGLRTRLTQYGACGVPPACLLAGKKSMMVPTAVLQMIGSPRSCNQPVQSSSAPTPSLHCTAPNCARKYLRLHRSPSIPSFRKLPPPRSQRALHPHAAQACHSRPSAGISSADASAAHIPQTQVCTVCPSRPSKAFVPWKPRQYPTPRHAVPERIAFCSLSTCASLSPSFPSSSSPLLGVAHVHVSWVFSRYTTPPYTTLNSRAPLPFTS